MHPGGQPHQACGSYPGMPLMGGSGMAVAPQYYNGGYMSQGYFGGQPWQPMSSPPMYYGEGGGGKGGRGGWLHNQHGGSSWGGGHTGATRRRPGGSLSASSARGHSGVTENVQTIPPAQRTTVMLRNMPEGFLRDNLTDMLNRTGFRGAYNFVYMPMNFRTKNSFGYAFVNMVSPEEAQRCHDKFQGFCDWGVSTDKVCEVSWSDMHQGLVAHIERYRNSPVMHESVPDEYKPVMFSDGTRVTFPAPTKKLRQPRIRRNDAEDGGPDDGLDDAIEDAAADAFLGAR